MFLQRLKIQEKRALTGKEYKSIRNWIDREFIKIALQATVKPRIINLFLGRRVSSNIYGTVVLPIAFGITVGERHLGISTP
jgi:hypothetical protein